MNTDFIEPYQENDFLLMEGFWWIPSKDDAVPEKVPGVLNFRTEDQGELRLMQPLETSGKFRVYDVIFGELLDGSKVTIFGAASHGVHGNIMTHPQMTCYVADIWLSSERHYESKSEIAFRQFVFGLSRLRAWDMRNGFRTDFSGKNNRISKASYKPPKDVIIYDDKFVTIKLSYWRSQSGWSLMQSEAYVRDYPRVVITAKEKRITYYGDECTLEYYFRRLTSLLRHLIGGQLFVYDMRGINFRKVKQEDGKVIEFPITTKHLSRRRLGSISKKETDALCDFPLRIFRKSICRLSSRYFDILSRVEIQLSKLEQFPIRGEGLSFETLFDLVVACDGIAENLFRKEGVTVLNAKLRKANSKDDVLLKERVFKLLECDAQATKWLTYKVGTKQGPSLAMWLRGALESVKAISVTLNDANSLTNLINYLKEVRQAGAHSLSDEYRHVCSDPELLVHITFFLYYIMRIMVLYKCGLRISTIRKALEAPSPWRHFKFYDSSVSTRMLSWKKLSKH